MPSRLCSVVGVMRLPAGRSFKIGQGKVLVPAPHNIGEVQLWWAFHVLEAALNAEIVG